MRICDYSNWHVPERTVRSLKRAFALLAFGSAFMHASDTRVGHQFDVKSIALIVYVGHQMMVENMPGGTSQYIWEVSDTKRTMSADELIEDLLVAIVDQNNDIKTWHQKLENLDVPYHYTKLFATMIASILVVLFSP